MVLIALICLLLLLLVVTDVLPCIAKFVKSFRFRLRQTPACMQRTSPAARAGLMPNAITKRCIDWLLAGRTRAVTPARDGGSGIVVGRQRRHHGIVAIRGVSFSETLHYAAGGAKSRQQLRCWRKPLRRWRPPQGRVHGIMKHVRSKSDKVPTGLLFRTSCPESDPGGGRVRRA